VVPVSKGFNEMLAMAQKLLESGFLPKSIKTAAAAFAIIVKGREVGIPEMQALAQIHVIEGKPTMAAELMLALAKTRAGVTATISEDTDEKCVIRFERPNEKPHVETFTFREAEAMGYGRKDNWIKQRRVMLRARCISRGLRFYAPDAISGISYTPEELGATTDEEGSVIEISHTSPVSKQGEQVGVSPVTEENGSAQDVQEYERLAQLCSSFADLARVSSKYGVLWENTKYLEIKKGIFQNLLARKDFPGLSLEIPDKVPTELYPEFYAIEEAHQRGKTFMDPLYYELCAVMEFFGLSEEWRSYANNLVKLLDQKRKPQTGVAQTSESQ
jgi:hypothetical protein